MQHLHRKPRVFLSHSKKDVEFIRRLDADLRACQCDTWIDEVEIRHGKPWLEEIFSTGMPSCEIVLCYITANSVKSAMVQKEIDARLIERLASDKVTLLVYVADAQLRNELRVDLQALQIPILNDENYLQLLPRIVSEIWRSYADSAIVQAIQSEKVRRLELELKLRDIEAASSSTIFSETEQAEFNAIWKQIDIQFETHVHVTERNKLGYEVEGTCIVSYGRLYRKAVCTQKIKPSIQGMTGKIGEDFLKLRPAPIKDVITTCDIPFDYESQLLRFGFLLRASRQISPSNNPIIDRLQQRFELVFTEKFDRFSFWLEDKFGPPSEVESVVLSVSSNQSNYPSP